MINLISDTVTKPTPGMLDAMMQAEVGDDVFGEDPTVNALEAKVAGMFGKEAAVFCPSGTMTNQIAIKVHTQPLDEVICDHYSHIYQYEAAGYAFNSGIGINLIQGQNGKINVSDISTAIRPTMEVYPSSKLVVLENTCNKGGGSYYEISEIAPIASFCKEKSLALHLDGARLFNALVETGESTEDTGEMFDSISICLSKGLGAPVGSLLIGDSSFIKQARRFRKVLGGGMRQAGFLAAAGLYALDHQIDRLKIDNERAKIIGSTLEKMNYVAQVRPVRSNIVIFDLVPDWDTSTFLERLSSFGIKAVPFGPNTIRFVTHLDFSEDMLHQTVKVLKQLSQ